MAGVGMRYWELSHSLANSHDILLSIPNKTDVKSETVKICRHNDEAFKKFISQADVVVAQDLTPKLILLCRKHGVRIINDAYDPVLFEDLEIFGHQSLKFQGHKINRVVSHLRLRLMAADAVICASDKQRDLWLGALMVLGKINTTTYHRDKTLNELVAKVPFGMSDTPGQKTGPGLREKFGIGKDDKVILWGGGIWNWFDPLSVIKAVAILAQKRDDVHLVFMGAGHPQLGSAGSEIADKAKKLAANLGVMGTHVHFNNEWVPYAERNNFYFDADLGISSHLMHVEAQFAFRTRVLDYFWADLPIIATEGDTLAQLISEHNMGVVVPAESPEAIVDAIESLIDNPERLNACKSNIREVKKDYTWSHIAKTLDDLITKVADYKPRKLDMELRRFILEYELNRISDALSNKGISEILKRIAKR
jgi:glycosyltransferase involved in cell wall biosynthesis